MALTSAVALVGSGKIPLETGFFAVLSGICIGDVGLYALGFYARRVTWLQVRLESWVNLKNLTPLPILNYTIVISRLIPGTRLPTYVLAGFLGYPLLRFIVLTLASVTVWVALAFVVGESLSKLVSDQPWSLFAFLLSGLAILKSVGPQLMDFWGRKALVHSWRRWLHFEFWPAWLFYLPVVPMYILLSIRHRSFLAPFYAKPDLENGGLIGESKWDFLKHLDSDDHSTLTTVPIEKDWSDSRVEEAIAAAGLSFPFIVKPDVGQRGFGVRVISNPQTLSDYLRQGDFRKLAQKLSLFQREAGIFYVREPSSSSGFLFSITDKKFPFVTGDGKTRVGDLILKDPRARVIAPVYFARLKDQLSRVPHQGEWVALTSCGNHCQGAIFENGEVFKSEALRMRIDRLAQQIPNFYFGRFDIRYRDPDSLMLGENFEIVEINGAGAEATHIWDRRATLLSAYRTLFCQWSHLFRIGTEMKKRHTSARNVKVLKLLRECFRVSSRNVPLSTSS